MKLRDPTGRLARWAIYLQAYSFDIIHRAGKKHANADAVSRALNYINCTQIHSVHLEEDDSGDDSLKEIDPKEDSCLLHFLETGKYLPGTSKKQCKRVERKALNFTLDGKVLWYHIDANNKQIKKEVPAIDSRVELVKHAHLLGHF